MIDKISFRFIIIICKIHLSKQEIDESKTIGYILHLLQSMKGEFL